MPSYVRAMKLGGCPSHRGFVVVIFFVWSVVFSTPHSQRPRLERTVRERRTATLHIMQNMRKQDHHRTTTSCSLPDGRRISCEVHRSAATQQPNAFTLVVLLHGMTERGTVFDAMAATIVEEEQELVASSRGLGAVVVVAPDRPGYGGSSPAPDATPTSSATEAGAYSYTYADQARDLVYALRSSVDVDKAAKVVLVGHSSGGPVALAVACELGGRAPVVLVGSDAEYALGTVPDPLPDLDAVLDMLPKFADAPRELLGMSSAVEMEMDLTAYREVLRSAKHAHAGVKNDHRLERTPWNLDQDVLKRTQIVIVCGDEDPFINEELVRGLAELLPHAEVATFPHVGHFDLVLHPPTIKRVLLPVVARLLTQPPRGRM